MGKKDAMFLGWQDIKKGFGEVGQGQSWGHRYGVITGLPVGERMGLGSWYWTMCGKRWTLAQGRCRMWALRNDGVLLGLQLMLSCVSKMKQTSCCRIDFSFPNPFHLHLRFTGRLLIQLWPYFVCIIILALLCKDSVLSSRPWVPSLSFPALAYYFSLNLEELYHVRCVSVCWGEEVRGWTSLQGPSIVPNKQQVSNVSFLLRPCPHPFWQLSFSPSLARWWWWQLKTAPRPPGGKIIPTKHFCSEHMSGRQCQSSAGLGVALSGLLRAPCGEKFPRTTPNWKPLL